MTGLGAALLGAALLALGSPVQARPASDDKKGPTIYCWMEQGRKICGDALPAKAVDNPRTEISAASGMPTRVLDRAPTDAERAAAEAQAALDQAAAQADAAKARRDMAMVESYATAADLKRAFEHRKVLIDEAVQTSTLGINGRRNVLLGLLRRASGSQLAGKPVAETLLSTIRQQHQVLAGLEAQLIEQRIERRNMDRAMADALERYHALKSPHSQATDDPQ